MGMVKIKASVAIAVASMFLSACSSIPTLGGSKGNGSIVTGSAAGGSQVDQNSDLDRCDETLGTISVFEDRQLPWWGDYRRHYPKLGSTVPVIRLMIQQSNCFVVVERGRAMASMNRERALMQSGQLRSGSNIGGGQMVAADYTISPSVLFAEKTGGIGGALAGFAGDIGKFAAAQMKSNEAETNLTLIENRSGVQVSSANGSAKNRDFGFLGGLFGGGNAGAAVPLPHSFRNDQKSWNFLRTMLLRRATSLLSPLSSNEKRMEIDWQQILSENESNCAGCLIPTLIPRPMFLQLHRRLRHDR